MVELVDVLHVAKDDVLFVDDPWWNLLHTAGHLPEICLQQSTKMFLLAMLVLFYYSLYFPASHDTSIFC